MSDHTSAELFGFIFDHLAEFKRKGIDVGADADRFWELTRDYYFAPYQIGEDEALIQLGLAKRGAHPDYPGKSVVLYRYTFLNLSGEVWIQRRTCDRCGKCEEREFA